MGLAVAQRLLGRRCAAVVVVTVRSRRWLFMLAGAGISRGVPKATDRQSEPTPAPLRMEEQLYYSAPTK